MTDQDEQAPAASTCSTCGNPLEAAGTCEAGCPPVPAADAVPAEPGR